MRRDTCSRVDEWLRGLDGNADNAFPPDHLVTHVSECPRCRGVLATLIADLTGPLARLADRSCDEIEERIAPCVDYERAYGVAAGAHAFPDVWWHTLACPRCADFYQTLHELAELPVEPWKEVVEELIPVKLLRPVIKIPIAMVAQMLHKQQRLGVTWGPRTRGMAVAEQEDEIGVIQLFLRRDRLGELALVVRTEPPISGIAVLTLEGKTYRESLDNEGKAVFPGLAEEIFSAGTGDLTLAIEAPTG